MRLLCAMSGGVDSSTAAGLLVEAGHEVVGVTLRLVDAGSDTHRATCCGSDDVDDARRVALHLGIPHYTLDRRTRFRATVVQRFVEAYVGGITPTPCTDCNDSVKIGPLVELAVRLGLDGLATGHYAQIQREDGRAVLRRAVDGRKDQSYFLFPVTPEALERLVLPLGAMTKSAVRAEARRMGLPVAEKPQSMEVCFAGGGAAAFVEAERPGLPGGDVVDTSGRVLGRHRGVHRFTVGQRRGLPARGREPLYALALDATNRRVVAGPESALYRAHLTTEDVRWHGERPRAAFEADVQIRSRSAPGPALVEPEARSARVRFHSPQRAVAPGQAAVFYRGDRIVGGGWIAATVLCLAMAFGAGCEVGTGDGEVSGTLHVPGCHQGDFDLEPDFFAAETFEEFVIIRVQRGADYPQYADGLIFGVDRERVALGVPTEVVAPDPASDSPVPPAVRASLNLGKTCHGDTLGLTGVGGSITFSSLVDDDTDLIEATFAVRFEDPVGGDSSADLAGRFRFTYERGRPAQRYP